MPFSPPFAQPVVLVVNDQPDQLTLLQELLTVAGFSVLTAGDGLDGFAAAQRERPDLILSDVMMPRMDGISLCRLIRQHADLRNTPVLLLSAVRKDNDSAVEGFEAGADDYLETPFEPERLVAQVSRLSERGRTEEALRRSEAQVRLLLDSTAEAIFAVDREGRCTVCNRAGVQMLGYNDPGELVGRAMHPIVHHTKPDGSHFPAAQCGIHRAIQQGKRVHVDGDILWRKDGSNFPVEYWSHPVHDGLEVVGAVVTFFDITERVQARQSLQATTERLQAIVSSLPIALWAIDRKGVITLSEGKLLGHLGFASGELVGQSVFDLYRDDAQVIDTVRRVLAGESPTLTFEVHGMTFESVYVPVRDADGGVTAAISVAMDVSDRAALEAQVRQGQKMEAVGRLAAGVAHDFNNLLTAILGFSDLALSGLDADHPVRPDVQEAINAARSAASLTRQLLAFSRQQILQPQLLDLNLVVRRMESLLRRTISEDIQLVCRLAPSLSRVSADSGQIEQAILNLAVNARDAMPAGGVLTIETSETDLDEAYYAQHPDAPPGPSVMLAISDTGIGMDASVQAHIFEPFYTTKAVGQGTGLGLATVYGLVKQSGGSIAVDSEVGYGTTFKIYLPRVAAPGCALESTEPRLPPQGGTETILLVEDQADVRAVARAVLTRNGYTVLEATCGDDALRVIEEHQCAIDLLLTDVVMPGLSGPGLAQQILDARPHVRVLYASGYADRAIVDNGVLLPGVAFIQKPFTPDDLLKKVRDTLAGK